MPRSRTLLRVLRGAERGAPAEPLAGEVHRVDLELDAGVLHRADVAELRLEAGLRREIDAQQQVARRRAVGVDRGGDAVVEPAEVEADVRLARRLPLEVGVRCGVVRRVADDVRAAERVVVAGERGERVVEADLLVARHAVAEAQLQVAEQRLVLHEPLVDHAPRKGGRGEEAPLVVLPEPAGAVGAAGDGEQVLVAEVVVRAAEVREERPIVVARARRGQRAGAQAVDAENVVGETRVARIHRLTARLLHGEPAEQVERVADDLAAVVERVLVDDVVVLARVRRGAALVGGTRRNGAGRESAEAVEHRRDAERAAEPQRVGEGVLAEPVADRVEDRALLIEADRVGDRVLDRPRDRRVQLVGAVGPGDRVGRIEPERAHDGRAAKAVVARLDLVERVRDGEVGARRQLLADVALQVDAARVAVEARADDDAALVEEAARER